MPTWPASWPGKCAQRRSASSSVPRGAPSHGNGKVDYPRLARAWRRLHRGHSRKRGRDDAYGAAACAASGPRYWSGTGSSRTTTSSPWVDRRSRQARSSTRVHAEMGVELTFRDIFDAPTLRELAAVIEARRELGRSGAGAVDWAGSHGLEYPLTHPQRRMWYLEQLHPGRPRTEWSPGYGFAGPFGSTSSRRRSASLVARHSALRATFHERDGVPVQVVQPAGQVPLAVIDLRAMSPHAQDEAVRPPCPRRGAQASRPAEAGPLFAQRCSASARTTTSSCWWSTTWCSTPGPGSSCLAGTRASSTGTERRDTSPALSARPMSTTSTTRSGSSRPGRRRTGAGPGVLGGDTRRSTPGAGYSCPTTPVPTVPDFEGAQDPVDLPRGADARLKECAPARGRDRSLDPAHGVRCRSSIATQGATRWCWACSWPAGRPARVRAPRRALRERAGAPAGRRAEGHLPDACSRGQAEVDARRPGPPGRAARRFRPRRSSRASDGKRSAVPRRLQLQAAPGRRPGFRRRRRRAEVPIDPGVSPFDITLEADVASVASSPATWTTPANSSSRSRCARMDATTGHCSRRCSSEPDRCRRSPHSWDDERADSVAGTRRAWIPATAGPVHQIFEDQVAAAPDAVAWWARPDASPTAT